MIVGLKTEDSKKAKAYAKFVNNRLNSMPLIGSKPFAKYYKYNNKGYTILKVKPLVNFNLFYIAAALTFFIFLFSLSYWFLIAPLLCCVGGYFASSQHIYKLYSKGLRKGYDRVSGEKWGSYKDDIERVHKDDIIEVLVWLN